MVFSDLPADLGLFLAGLPRARTHLPGDDLPEWTRRLIEHWERGGNLGPVPGHAWTPRHDVVFEVEQTHLIARGALDADAPERLVVFERGSSGAHARYRVQGPAPIERRGVREAVFLGCGPTDVFVGPREEDALVRELRAGGASAERTPGRLTLIYHVPPPPAYAGERRRRFARVAPCVVCGVLAGTGYNSDDTAGRRLVCRCDWIPCRECAAKLKPPNTDDLNPETGHVWHMPWFGAGLGRARLCPSCLDRRT